MCQPAYTMFMNSDVYVLASVRTIALILEKENHSFSPFSFARQKNKQYLLQRNCSVYYKRTELYVAHHSLSQFTVWWRIIIRAQFSCINGNLATASCHTNTTTTQLPTCAWIWIHFALYTNTVRHRLYDIVRHCELKTEVHARRSLLDARLVYRWSLNSRMVGKTKRSAKAWWLC